MKIKRICKKIVKIHKEIDKIIDQLDENGEDWLGDKVESVWGETSNLKFIFLGEALERKELCEEEYEDLLKD